MNEIVSLDEIKPTICFGVIIKVIHVINLIV